MEWSKPENWYFHNLFYHSPYDSRPFVDVHRSHASKWYSTKKTTINFANMEATAWLGGIVVVGFYPIIRRYFIEVEATDTRIREVWLKGKNWFGPWKIFYSCADDPRPFVPIHPDRRQVYPRWWLTLNRDKLTMNWSHNVSRLWLLFLTGFCAYPYFRKE